MAASALARIVYLDAFCQPMRPCSPMHWRWRSRCVGVVAAVSLGTAVARGGTTPGGVRGALSDIVVGAALVVAAVADERGHLARDLVEQRADLRGVVHVAVGECRSDDLACVSIEADVQLQPRAVHQQVYGLTLASCAGAARPWPR